MMNGPPPYTTATPESPESSNPTTFRVERAMVDRGSTFLGPDANSSESREECSGRGSERRETGVEPSEKAEKAEQKRSIKLRMIKPD